MSKLEQSLAILAQKWEDPNFFVRQLLISCGIDERKVDYYMRLSQKEAPTDTLGKIIPELPFVDGPDYPYVGIMIEYIKTGDSLIKVEKDTLWDIRSCKKEE